MPWMRIWLIPVAGVAGFALAVVPALAHDESVGTTMRDWTKKEVAVAPGHKLTIKNTPPGGGRHDLHWSDGAEGVPEPGLSWTSERTFTAEDEGKALRFVCKVHDGMVGTVHVNQAETVPQAGTTTGGGTTTGSSTPTPTPTPTGETTTGAAAPTPEAGLAPSTDETTEPDRLAPRVERLTAQIRGRRLIVRLRLDEAARVTVRVSRGRRAVGRGTFRARAGANRFVLRRALPQGSLRVRVTVADPAGNVARRSLTLRR